MGTGTWGLKYDKPPDTTHCRSAYTLTPDRKTLYYYNTLM